MIPPRADYSVIYADPPWTFETYSKRGRDRCPDTRHYSVMPLNEIKALPVGDWAAKDAVLFLWVTDPYLRLAFEVIDAWGFKYSTVGFYWVKEQADGSNPIGAGYWTRANPEQCLLAKRGSVSRNDCGIPKLIKAPRREHSRKPDEVRGRIERLVRGPYLELFARTTAPGWDVCGNETEKFVAPKMDDQRFAQQVSQVYSSLAKKQQSLGAEFEVVLENPEKLYET